MGESFAGSYGLEVRWTEEEVSWAHAMATPECHWRCRLSGHPKAQLFLSQVIRVEACSDCHLNPWPWVRYLSLAVWAHFGQLGALRLWNESYPVSLVGLQCPVHSSLQINSRSTCIIGNLAYALLCFLHLAGGNLLAAYIHLESAMDLAKFVGDGHAVSSACGDWGLSVTDLAWNYERHLVAGWHEQSPVPPAFWEKAPGTFFCPRPRQLEPQERTEGVELQRRQAFGPAWGSPTRCRVGACEEGEFIRSGLSRSIGGCQVACARTQGCQWFSYCPAHSGCPVGHRKSCTLHASCSRVGRKNGDWKGYRVCELVPPADGGPAAPSTVAPARVDQGARERAAQASSPPRQYTVQCLVLAVLPDEAHRIRSISETFARDCESLQVVTATLGDGGAAARLHGLPVVNLRHHAADVPLDPARYSKENRAEPADVNYANTIYKTIHAVLQAHSLHERDTSGDSLPDVTCRLDADTFFVPDNLRRVLACRGFDARKPWAIGHVMYVHKHSAPSVAFPFGGSGVCFSRGAVERLQELYERGGIRFTDEPGSWATGECLIGPGHWDDVTLAVCMRKAGIPISRWSTNCHGRELFWPLEFGDAQRVRMPQGPWRSALTTGHVRGGIGSKASYNFWRYRSLQFLTCENRRWLGKPFLVSFHNRRGNLSDATRMYASMGLGRHASGNRLRRWDGAVTAEACEDLIC